MEMCQKHGGWVMNNVLVHEAADMRRKTWASGKNFCVAVAKHYKFAKKPVASVAIAPGPVFHFVAGFDRDMRNEGWRLITDFDGESGEFTPELVELFNKRGAYIGGERVLSRAHELEVSSGQRQAEAMLRERGKIPREWRKNHQYTLVFPDTIWLDTDKKRRMACLSVDINWRLHFRHLDGDFESDCRLVRIHPSR